MWYDLYIRQRQRYKQLLTDFASWGHIFAGQHAHPVVNLPFAKVAFQNSFVASTQGIVSPTFDYCIDHSENKNHTKYLIGLRVVTDEHPYQPLNRESLIVSRKWDDNERLTGLKTIAQVWNERIQSAQENMRGFKNEAINVESVYHVLHPTISDQTPQVQIGETSCPHIDVDNIQDLQKSTSQPHDLLFNDGNHYFMYQSDTGQLWMNFINPEITLKKWPITYTDQPVTGLRNMGQRLISPQSKIIASHSWYLDVRPYSGLNAFYGKSKLSRAPGYREKRIQKLVTDFTTKVATPELNVITDYLKRILLNDWRGDEGKKHMVALRDELMQLVYRQQNPALRDAIVKIVYRPATEIEFRIPNSKQFHRLYPHFFVDDIIYKFSEDRRARTFKLRFKPSNDEIKAYVGQDTGKAINFLDSQEKLGRWILRDIFQLRAYEPLTKQRMQELRINGIRFTKVDDYVEFSFIWIDANHEPADLWRQVDHVETLF